MLVPILRTRQGKFSKRRIMYYVQDNKIKQSIERIKLKIG